MNKLIASIVLLLSFSAFADDSVKQKPRIYDYLIGIHGEAKIIITNKDCQKPDLKDKWPKAAFVVNSVTGQGQEACYGRVEYDDPNKKGQKVEFVHIQWKAGDDPNNFSELPPNLFLQPHSFPQNKEPVLKKELEV